MESVTFKTTDGKHTAKLKAFLSRRERREINNALFGDTKINIGDGEKVETEGFTLAGTSVAEDAKIGCMLIELDGSAENVTDRYLDLPDQAATEILEKIDELAGDTKDAKRKKGIGAPTTTT